MMNVLTIDYFKSSHTTHTHIQSVKNANFTILLELIYWWTFNTWAFKICHWNSWKLLILLITENYEMCTYFLPPSQSIGVSRKTQQIGIRERKSVWEQVTIQTKWQQFTPHLPRDPTHWSANAHDGTCKSCWSITNEGDPRTWLK